MPELDRIYQGDVLGVLCAWPAAFVHCVVTSPPYWALRNYGVEGQLGLEKTPTEYIIKMREVFREVWRVLRPNGTLWLNMGDCYISNSSNGWQGKNSKKNGRVPVTPIANKKQGDGLKNKDLVGMPWRLALALQADGWYLRRDIIWHKKNPMPEAVRDRPTTAHEYLFLLSKRSRYYYDAAAIKEPVTDNAHRRGLGVNPKCAGWADGPGSHSTIEHARSGKDSGRESRGLLASTKFGRGPGWRVRQNASFSGAVKDIFALRNKRSVWTLSTQPCKEAHFSTFPEKLVEPCILAGTMVGGIVLDPFMGAGTTALVAARLNRRYLGIELNPEYIVMAERRVAAEAAQGKLF